MILYVYNVQYRDKKTFQSITNHEFLFLKGEVRSQLSRALTENDHTLAMGVVLHYYTQRPMLDTVVELIPGMERTVLELCVHMQEQTKTK